MIRTTAGGTVVLLVLIFTSGGAASANETIQLSIKQSSHVAGETFDITVQTKDSSGQPIARKLNLAVRLLDGQGPGRVVQRGEISTREGDGLARVELSLEQPGSYTITGTAVHDSSIVSNALNLQIAGARILDDRVDQILRDWAARAKGIQSLWAEFDRTVYDKVWNNKEHHVGQACYLAPNRARLDIKDIESYVVNGKGEIWEYKPPLKQIKVYHLPPEMVKNQDLQDGPLPFLFGTDPERAKARYRFKIVEESAKSVHLAIYPKLREDQQNFVRAEVWLNKETFLPDRLMFQEPNSNEITFEFSGRIWINIEIEEDKYFECKEYADWRVIHQNVEVREK